MSTCWRRTSNSTASAVFGLEEALRSLLTPDKVNVASLGNVVAHVHWHVIPRYRDDAHFPGSIWSAPLRAHSPVLPADFSEHLRQRLAVTLAR
ncbi:MAG: HIT domain-containing protein [Betaproteobacteria bacterium]|nr:HIT domain-containing protein [Betaproteobacteria bacterium]